MRIVLFLYTIFLSTSFVGCGEESRTGDPPKSLKSSSQALISGITPGGLYWLTAQVSGFRLSVCHDNLNDGGEICQTVPSLTSCAQRWRIEPVPSAPGYYWLTSTLTNYRLDVLHANRDSGGPICQAKSNMTDAQQWLIEEIPGESGYYHLTAKNSSLMLDVYGANTDNYGRICQAYPNGSAAQKWHIEPPATSEVCPPPPPTPPPLPCGGECTAGEICCTCLERYDFCTTPAICSKLCY